MSAFCSLHSHSTHSVKDGWGLPEEMVARAIELGHTAIGLTDHGVCSGHVPLWQVCKGTGVKPVYGVEYYIVDDLTSRVKGVESLGIDETPHVTVLALTQKGYGNLLKLSRISFQGGFYGRPRIDWETLARYSDGLAVLSGCVGGHVSRILHAKGPEEAHDFLGRWGSRIQHFYVEVNPCPGYSVSEDTLLPLVQVAQELGLPCVVTADSHFPRPEDYRAQDMLFACGTGRRVDDPTRTHRIPSWAYQCGVKELYQRLHKACPTLADPSYDSYIREGLRNTGRLAEMAEVELPRAEPLKFAGLKLHETADNRLWRDAVTGLEQKLGRDHPEFGTYLDRMAYELDVLTRKGVCDYLLTVIDLIREMQSRGATVLTRGSAGGCALLWAAGGSMTDPIRHRLSFHRFYNEHRDAEADIDVDMSPAWRAAALEYVAQVYGAANVAQLANFSKFSTKSAVKAVASALGIPLGEVAAVSAALTGEDDDVTGQLASITDPKARAVLEKYPELAIADRFVGQMNAYGIHACGLLVSPTPLDDVIAVMRGKGGQIVSSIDKRGAKALGFLKLDLLSVKGLDILDKCLQLIDRKPEWLSTLPLDDPKTLALARELTVAGVFQLSGSAARRVGREIRLDTFEDMVVASAICRPGPAEMAPVYGRNKRNPQLLEEMLSKFHPVAAELVRPTFGLVIFQETVMQLARDLAGLDWPDVQSLRKGISDKLGTQADREKADAWKAEWRGKFVGGCIANGVDPKEAEYWWSTIETHGGYSFNRSHAVTYALLGFWMLYVKAHHPDAYYAAYLSLEEDGSTRKELLREYVALGGEVRVLDPVHSRVQTHSPEPGVIVGGFADLHNIGASAAEKLLAKGPFTGWAALLAAMTPTFRARVEASGLPTGAVNPQALVALAPWYPVPSMPANVVAMRERKRLRRTDDLPLGRTLEEAQFDDPFLDYYGEDLAGDETVIVGFVTHRNVSPKSVELLIEDEAGVCPVRVSSKRLRQLGPMFRELQLGDLVAVNGWWSGDTLYCKGRAVIAKRPVIGAAKKRPKKEG